MKSEPEEGTKVGQKLVGYLMKNDRAGSASGGESTALVRIAYDPISSSRRTRRFMYWRFPAETPWARSQDRESGRIPASRAPSFEIEKWMSSPRLFLVVRVTIKTFIEKTP